MKNIRNLALVGVLAFMTSCSSAVTFPVSKAVPAAEITVLKKQDKNKNYLIELTAVNLAEANRIDPSMNNYSVWIVTENGSTKNIGQLTNKNAKKVYLSTVTPYNVKEIFITAEKQGNLSYPAGIEISRTWFDK